ncbi:MAG TPA: hypothetical protein VE981_13930, partial [Planctomycetota bacterium]|nr:hypothetical protein [Planctomycetota bacterium]
MPSTPDPSGGPTTALRQNRGRRFWWIGLALSVAATVGLSADLRWTQSKIREETLARARVLASQAAGSIDKSFHEARDLAEAIAQDLGKGVLPYGEIEKRMRDECGRRADLDGVAITFQPFAYQPGQKLYQEYVSRQLDGQLGILKGASYDYSQPPSSDPNGPKTSWYHTPLSKGPTWNEPFLATGARKVLIEYGTTFKAAGDAGKTGGVVTADYSLEGLQELMTRLDLGATGYGVVFTGKGTFLAHPNRSEVVHGSTSRDETFRDPRLQEGIRRVLAGSSSVEEHFDPLTGKDVWILFEPVASTGWGLALIIQQEEDAVAPRMILRSMIHIAFAGGASLLCLLALAVRLERGTTSSLWIWVGGFSGLCAALILLTWILSWDVDRPPGTPVTSRVTIERYLERYRLSLTKAEASYEIPTGMQITALKFPDAGSVTIGGYVWQRYPDNMPKELRKGFTLPHELGEQQTMDEVERIKQGTEEVIVWRIILSLQQSFNPRLFPFDRRNVSVLLQPLELDANIVLTPDLTAFPVMTPRALPGVAKDFQVNNWRLQESFFTYQLMAPASTIGIVSRTGRPAIPTMAFNLTARRHFVGPFIAYLLPALVAAGLTFAFLMTRREIGDPEDLLNGLSYVAALFFVIVVSHTALRENVGAVSIT